MITIKNMINGVLIGLCVAGVWALIFKYYTMTAFDYGMAILPAIIIGIVLFVVSFSISMFVYRLRRKKKE